MTGCNKKIGYVKYLGGKKIKKNLGLKIKKKYSMLFKKLFVDVKTDYLPASLGG